MGELHARALAHHFCAVASRERRMLQTALLPRVLIDFTWFNVRADCSGAEKMWGCRLQVQGQLGDSYSRIGELCMPLRPIEPSKLTPGMFSSPTIQNRGYHDLPAALRTHIGRAFKDRLTCSVLLFLAASLVTLLPTPSSAQYTQAVLYNFCAQNGCTDGSGPTSTPLFDAHGNMYGVAGGGGAN